MEFLVQEDGTYPMSAGSKRTRRSIALAVLLAGLSMRPAYPQTTYGAVVGTALDNSGSCPLAAWSFRFVVQT